MTSSIRFGPRETVALGLLAASWQASAATFGDEVSFLKQHTDVIVLSDKEKKAEVVLVPAWQGRVMTSTAAGNEGASFGWINHELIASGKLQPHINVFGGEDRFWLGPEGGQFALFFAKGAPFDLEHWFTPAPIDTLPCSVARQTMTQTDFRAQFSLTNYAGARFAVQVDRQVKLLSAKEAWRELHLKPLDSVNLVAYESINKISNTGAQPWTRETGLLSIWILGQFNPSPSTTIVVPIKAGSESELGPLLTSDYFGEIPPDRLSVKGNTIYFSGDGRCRSKIGINPRRSQAVLGSYDADHRALTIVQFSQPKDAAEYVNSLWKIQDHPFAGDVENSYNDGPPSAGAKPLGPFYEMESSSPAAALVPGASMGHTHCTIHLIGDEPDLDQVARSVLGVSLEEIEHALPKH
jgi:hypothetical protein